jgi:hypothetical protein
LICISITKAYGICSSVCVHAVAGLQASKAFFEAERRYSYTTPKTFLELIKLYKNVLTGKRKQTQEAIDR